MLLVKWDAFEGLKSKANAKHAVLQNSTDYSLGASRQLA
jgi:hypothetical protein